MRLSQKRKIMEDAIAEFGLFDQHVLQRSVKAAERQVAKKFGIKRALLTIRTSFNTVIFAVNQSKSTQAMEYKFELLE